MRHSLLPLLLTALAGAAFAQDAEAPATTASDPAAGIEINLDPGAYVRPYRHYDPETNTIMDGADEGAEELCLRIVGPDPEGLSVLHVSGIYKPSWSDTPIEPGGMDVWFSSDAYIEKNPGADRLTLLKLIWRNVPNCRTETRDEAEPDADDTPDAPAAP